LNPHINYAISFAAALVAFLVGWSDLYPPPTSALLIFAGLTLLIHGWLAYRWRFRPVVAAEEPVIFKPVPVTIFIYVLWGLDFLYEGGIPLIKILLGQPYNYRAFGFPSVHVFTVTFASFYTVYLFGLFLHTRKRIYLYLYGINLVAALLIYSRAMLLFNLFGSFQVLLFYTGGISRQQWAGLFLGLIVLAFGFGWMGSKRVSFESGKNYDPNLFLDIGEASTGFRQSMVPPEFLWSYIYLSSPLANFQQNLNTYPVPKATPGLWARMINNEMLPDFISKRINRLFSTGRSDEHVMPGKPFNVSTVYSRSYCYLGWTGLIVMGLLVACVPAMYLRWLPDNSYAFAGLAILNTMYFFLFYDNTIRFTGLSLQLTYPFLLPAGERLYRRIFQPKLTV
jgi:hypothetical protein